MSVALSELTMRVARAMGGNDFRQGTPSGSYTTTGFDCDNLSAFGEDFFNNWYGHFYAATNIDLDFDVTNFVTTTGHFTFVPAVTLVDAADLFWVCMEYRGAEIIDAINEAISMIEKEALQDKVDATLAVAADQWEYTIPTGFEYIEDIYKEASTDDLYSPSGAAIHRGHWRILHGATPKIWLDNELIGALTTGANLRVVGQQFQAQLSADADTCGVNAAYIVQQAKALLHQSRIQGAGGDFEKHETQMRLAQAMADRQASKLRVPSRGLRVSN